MKNKLTMEDLIQYCESEAACLDLLRTDLYCDISESDYTSVITFDGWPILPPVMTQQRRQEMLLYKHQAVMVESRIKARIRQQLLAKVDSVIEHIGKKERSSSAPTSPTESSTIPPLQDISLSENDECLESHQVTDIVNPPVEQAVDVKKTSPVAELVHTPSPRTCTKDSGVFSKCLTASESSDKQSLKTVSEADVDERLDTMANVTDLSSEDAALSGEEASETTAIEMAPVPVSNGSTEDRTENSEDQIHSESEDSSHGTVVKESSDSDKENTEFVLQEGISASDSEHSVEDAKVSGECSTEFQPLGSKERVEQLVKKLDMALKYHERQRASASTIMSLPSTNSSATTLSSNEMNQTVIDREDTALEQHLAESDTKNSSDSLAVESIPSTDEHSTSEVGMTAIGDDHILNNDPPVVHDVNSIVSGHEENTAKSNIGSCSLNSSLLSRVVLETPDETSEELSELDGSHSAHECVSGSNMPGSDTGDRSLSVASPGPVNTPDLSSISHITEDSKVDQPCPISVALRLGGSIHSLKHSVENIAQLNAESPPDNSLTSLCKSSKSQSPNDPFLHSVGSSQLCTESTELAPYMNNNTDTVPNSLSTLPYSQTADQLNANSATCSPGDSPLPLDGHESEETDFKDKSNVGRLRKNSYVLEYPSPGLIAAQEEQCKKSATEGMMSGVELLDEHHNSRTVSLTSSMEDLKLKPVQRKLDYNPTNTTTAPVEALKPILKKAPPTGEEHSCSLVEMDSTVGKEEHLNRYLQQLSQAPCSSTQSPSTANTYGNPSYIQPVPQLVAAPLEVTGLGQLSQEELIQLQIQYFEMMKQQLIEQQRQQLALLFAEQERQQMLLQQELLQQQQQQSNSVVMLKKQQLQQTNAKLKGVKASPYLPSSISPNTDAMPKVTDGEYEARPYSAPVSRVSFAPSPMFIHHSNSKSPSGVYCNQDFPLSSHDASLLESHFDREVQQHSTAGYSYPSVQHNYPNAQQLEHAEYINNTSQMYSGGVYHKQPEFIPTSIPASTTVLNQTTCIQNKDLPPSLLKKFEKISAAAKGFLVRKLMKTNKVQQLIKIIKDTAEFALHFQQETPIKKGIFSQQDRVLHQRVLAQLTAAMYEIHEIFFEISPKEQMAIIRQSRIMEQERLFRQSHHSEAKSKWITSASKKALERRRKAKAAEAIVFGHVRPKSCPPETSSPKNSRVHDLRALQPIQAQLSPIKPDKDTGSQVASHAVKKQMTPRSKLGGANVKRIQSKPKSVTGRAVKKTNATPSLHSSSRVSSQTVTNSPSSGKNIQSKTAAKPASQTNRHLPQANSRMTYRSDRKISNQGSIKRITAAGSKTSGSGGSVKSAPMTRHTSQTNKARVLSQGTPEAAQNMIKRIMAQSKAAVEK